MQHRISNILRLAIVAIFALLVVGCSFRLEGEIRPLDLQQTETAHSD